jgi:2-hydroxychromene-2-carboxylate isomerase
MSVPEFHFDFVSPNAYLAHKVLPDYEQRMGCEFHYVPVSIIGQFKLTNNVPTPVALKGIRNKPAYIQLDMQRFVEKHGLTSYRMSPHFPFNSLNAMLGAVAADQLGCCRAYANAIFRAIWEEGIDPGDEAQLWKSVADAGLAADDIFTSAADPAVREALDANTAASVENGSFGSPSFLVGSELFFGKDRLDQVEEAVLKQQKL